MSHRRKRRLASTWIEAMESRTFLTATPVPIDNPGFETVYRSKVIMSPKFAANNTTLSGTLTYNDGPNSVVVTATLSDSVVHTFHDDGNGAFTGDVAIASSSVDYQTNAFSITLSNLTFSPTSQVTGGGDTVTGTFPGGAGTFSTSVFTGAKVLYQVKKFPYKSGFDPAMMTFSDGQTAGVDGGPATAFVDIPGWSAPVFPSTYGGVKSVAVQINPPRDEMQTVKIAGTLTGGTYTITFNAQTTPAIAFDATLADVQTALDATFGAGVITASGTAQSNMKLSFGGPFAQTDVPAATVDISNLSGATSVSESQSQNASTGTGPTLYPGKNDNVLYLSGPDSTRGFPNTYGYGPSFQTVQQTLTTNVQPNTLYTLSVDVGWEGDLDYAVIDGVDYSGIGNDPAKIPVTSVFGSDGKLDPTEQLVVPIISNVEVSGKPLTLVSTNMNQVLHSITPGTFQTLTETFLTGATVPANAPLTVVLGLGPDSNASGKETDFDNVTLVADTIPATSNLQASISAPDLTSTDPNTPLPAEQITVTYTSTDGGTIDAGSIGTGNLLITTPYGATLPVGSVVGTAPAAGGGLTVTYSVPARNGNFTAADNGAYTVTTVPNSVTANGGTELVGINNATFMVLAASDTAANLLKGVGSIGFTAEKLASQADGKTVVAGHNGYPFDFASQSRAVLQRFNVDGSVDTTFGNASQGNIAELSGTSAFFGVAIQSNGDIVAVGTQNGDMLAARFDASGALDPTFANNGIFLAGINGNSSLSSVQIAPDGKIVLGGANASGDYVLIRLNSDGTPDSTFNTGGSFNSKVPINIAGGTAKEVLQGTFLGANGGELRLNAGQSGNAVDQIVLQPNSDGDPTHYQIYAVGDGIGNILVAGSQTRLSGSEVVAVVGVDSTGNPGTFGGDKVPTGTQGVSVFGLELVPQLIPLPIANNFAQTPVGLALQSDGKIIVAAGTPDPTNPDNNDFGVARLDSTGHLDMTFGTGGVAIAAFPGNQSYANSVSVDPKTGQIIVYGTSYGTGSFETAIAVFTSDGMLDPTFNIPGNTPGTLSLPSGITTGRAFHPLNVDFGLTNGILNSDGSVIITTADVTTASASSIRRLQIVYPFPQISASAVTATNNTTTTQFTVIYTAPGGSQIDVSTVAANNITVTGPNGVVPVTVFSTGLTNAEVVAVQYQIATPSGANFASTDEGNYTVSLTGTVNDTSGRPVQPGQFGTFALSVVPPGATGDLTVSAPAGRLTGTIVGGTKYRGTFKVVVTNSSQTLVNGPVTVTLYVSTADNTINGAIPFGTLTHRVHLKPGKSTVFLVRGQTWPIAGGNYFLLATASLSGTSDNNLAATSAAVAVAPPVVDLSNLAVSPLGTKLIARRDALFVTVQNVGNTLASGTASVTISATSNGVSTQIASVPVKLRLNPGQKRKILVSYVPTTLPPAGSYNLTAQISLAADTNNANDSMVSLLQVTV